MMTSKHFSDWQIARYRSLMEEVKLRLEAVELISKRFDRTNAGFENVVNFECAIVQIRKSIELISVCVLLAHNSIKIFQHRNLIGEYHSGRLISRLERLNKNCFPLVCEGSEFEPDQQSEVLIVRDDDGRAKKDILNIYKKCGGYLHSNSLYKFLSDGGSKFNLTDAIIFRNSLVSLLDFHAVILPKEDEVLVTAMSGGPNRSVECWILKTDEVKMAAAQV